MVYINQLIPDSLLSDDPLFLIENCKKKNTFKKKIVLPFPGSNHKWLRKYAKHRKLGHFYKQKIQRLGI